MSCIDAMPTIQNPNGVLYLVVVASISAMDIHSSASPGALLPGWLSTTIKLPASIFYKRPYWVVLCKANESLK